MSDQTTLQAHYNRTVERLERRKAQVKSFVENGFFPGYTVTDDDRATWEESIQAIERELARLEIVSISHLQYFDQGNAMIWHRTCLHQFQSTLIAINRPYKRN